MKTHIEINASNLVHNLQEFHRLTGNRIMFVVKANAYGHGLKEVTGITRDLSFIDYYAVDSVEEALIIKKLSDKKILIMGWADKDQIKEIISNEIEMVVPSVEYLKEVKSLSKELKKTAKIHLKVETGTARMGMRPGEIVNILERSSSSNNNHLVENVGIYSHFANIEDTTDHSYAQYQLEVFTNLMQKINPSQLLKHFSCSAATLLFPKTHFDIARVGISAYGFWPSRPTYVSYIERNKTPIQLKPVLSWHSRAAQVKSLEKGEAIGYGLTYKTYDRSKVIVVPVGYYDGYDRKLSNMSTIIANGAKAPVRGRVCMNMIMAEVTHIKDRPVKPGDRVILIGEEGNEKITADHLAEWAGTINYEIVSRLNPLIPRLVV